MPAKPDYELILEAEALEDLCKHLSTRARIGVDLEGEWNLHRYGLHLCLIQICDGENTWLIDPYECKDLSAFIRLMENEKVVKISHGPQSDILLLNLKFGAEPKTIFDTEKAAQFLGYPVTSLSGLLENKFNVIKNSKIRQLDWINRPLTEEMLIYAAMDVKWLLPLHDMMTQELESKGRLRWHQEENLALENLRYKKKETPHLELKGVSKLTDVQIGNLKALYEVRDSIASELDKPAYHIIPNDKLVEMAAVPPLQVDEWENLKGINPKAKVQAGRFIEAIALEAENLRILKESESAKTPSRPRMTSARVKWGARLSELLEKVKVHILAEYDVAALVLSSRMIKRITFGEIAWMDLKNWQREIILRIAKEKDIDLSLLEHEFAKG